MLSTKYILNQTVQRNPDHAVYFKSNVYKEILSEKFVYRTCIKKSFVDVLFKFYNHKNVKNAKNPTRGMGKSGVMLPPMIHFLIVLSKAV